MRKGGQTHTHNEDSSRVLHFCEASQLMLHREMITVCSEIHTKDINILWGLNINFCLLNMVMHTATTRL